MRNPILYFKLSNDIVLDVGSDVFTEDVSVRTEMIDVGSMNGFCFGIFGNYMYRNGYSVSAVSPDIFVTLIVAPSAFGLANLSLVLRMMGLALDVF